MDLISLDSYASYAIGDLISLRAQCPIRDSRLYITPVDTFKANNLQGFRYWQKEWLG